MVNDLYEEFRNCRVELEIRDASGLSLHNETFDIKRVEENSAQKFFDVSADVLTSVEDQFTVHLVMKDEEGQVVSSNEYMLLMGDQAAASARYKEYLEERRAKQQIHPYGTYYRFYPDMIRKDGKDYKSGTEIPRAEGF